MVILGSEGTNSNPDQKQMVQQRTGKTATLFKNIVRQTLRQMIRNSRWEDGFWWIEKQARRYREFMIINKLKMDFGGWRKQFIGQ